MTHIFCFTLRRMKIDDAFSIEIGLECAGIVGQVH